MRRILIITCLLALLAACRFEGSDHQDGTSAPLVSGPVSEIVGLSSLIRGGTSESAQAVRDYQLSMNAAGGIRYLRNEFMWHNIEPSQGNFDFSKYDTIVAEAEEHGLEFIPVLCYGVPWAAAGSGGDKMYPPDDPADFADFAYMTVSRYKDRIHNWEVWNEPNNQDFWKTGVDPEAYGYLLKAASDAIRAADPEAKVAFGGPAPAYDGYWLHMWGFVEEVYAFHPDIGDYFDVIAIHTYTWVMVAEPETDSPTSFLLQSVPTMIQDAKNVLLRWDGRLKPIWITEIGWHTAVNEPLGHVTEEQQAQYLVRSFILSVANGVTKYCWFTFRDAKDYLIDRDHGLGLVGYDPDPTDGVLPYVKPSYYAYQTMAHVLGDTYYSADLRAGLGLTDAQYGYRFITPDGKKAVVVLWTINDGLEAVLVPSEPDMNKFTMVDMLGNVSVMTPSHGLLPCVVSQSPVYLVEEKQ